MKLTLQEEAEKIYYEDPAAHDASGIAANDRIEHSEISYHGNAIKVLYFPKAFTGEGYALVKRAGETMWRILIRVMEEYYAHEDYRKLFGFPKVLEELILARPHYRCLLPICRLDMFLNEETGEFRYCEFNADGSSAMNENRVMAEVYRETKMYEALNRDYVQRPFELFDSWVRVFLEICKDTNELPEHPNVAVVDFLEKSINTTELQRFAEAFERAGSRAEVAEIRDLAFDGAHLYTKDGMRVDAIYRRAVTSDVLAHREEIESFLSAVREKKVCLVGDFCTQIVHDKILFRILHLERTFSFLSEEEADYIREHVPYTAVLTRETAKRGDVRDTARHWILKPQDSYGAQGIYDSSDYDSNAWGRLLDEHADKGCVVQEFVQPYRTLNADYTKTDYGNNAYQQQAAGQKSPYVHSFANMTGMYLYGGKLAGIYSRLSPHNIISVEGDEHEMVSVVATPRKG
jgi:glutathionylspermidine synthase